MRHYEENGPFPTFWDRKDSEEATRRTDEIIAALRSGTRWFRVRYDGDDWMVNLHSREAIPYEEFPDEMSERGL